MDSGQITGGEYGEIIIRQKSGETLEIGDLLIADGIYFQVFDLEYGSLMQDRELSMMSGFQLEDYGDVEVMDEKLRNYVFARAKPLISLVNGRPVIPKVLPRFFSKVRRIEPKDLEFLEKPENPLYLGRIRCGSRVLDTPVHIDGKNALTHHILIPATTGRGKSNLVKVILYDLLDKDYCGILVLDPHDEYYGRSGIGLKDHPKADRNLRYYSPNAVPGQTALMINLRYVMPRHLRGIIPITEAQWDAMYLFFRKFGEHWLRELMTADPAESESSMKVQSISLNTIQRKLGLLFNISESGDARGRVFTIHGGERTIDDIVDALESAEKVIIDTSALDERLELLIGSIIANKLFDRYKKHKEEGNLDAVPVVSFVLEEAPRVLSEGTGERSIFNTIAREGRKFQIGLIAITQLASMIPSEILANMNTKIILGNEMAAERHAIIGSAAQDLSKDSKMIGALDKGEAIVSSIFTKFAVPIKIDLFEPEEANEEEEKKPVRFFG